MLAKRIIARLDIKPPNKLVKGIQLEGLRPVGNPHERAVFYAGSGADELLLMDIDASLDGRCGIVSLVRSTAEGVFVPLTAGGGIRTVADVRSMLMAGADKVCVNTAAIRRPEFIAEVAAQFGRQCISVAIEYNGNLCFTDCGREHTGRDPYEWALEAVDRGAGELILTSIERDGTKRGFDCDLVARLASKVRVPLVVHGGCGSVEHVTQAIDSGADAVAVASVLHYNKLTIKDLKKGLHANPVRAS